MRKSNLITLLNTIPGNPQIKLWNGFVQDWVDIDPELQTLRLVRMTKEYWLESCRLQGCHSRLDYTYTLAPEKVQELTARYPSVCKWEINEYVTEEDIALKRYAVRNVRVVQAKTKGVKTFDRYGDIKY